ncbi:MULTISPECIES: DedA family protein [Clostridium]|jgi:membrane protein DedA with SNARE-associated domain|uniref:DedA family protein n=1 Tax=Clostridium tertium TaxID=1559 RepID=A0A9X4B422_9CLOT|nr:MULTISPECIES: DedA family protein [Clostridium]EEH98567.1 hypothetical protein CSBG_02193 [Clostridium sp. 7_2_43FAA]MBU6136550.1 DedA family protein [Clostridium tertium]MDB1932908.1 DedA family protein [Clostridium tertium]MDB1936971.1 DedA family protein [Clostridium tertium]MDB1940567.1 DedA family protein [Clostridium tertium]
MDVGVLNQYFSQYGIIVVFIIVFLEYLNLPGFPAGIIMPLAGVWASKGGVNIILVISLSVLAGLLGSWALYFLGRFFGEFILEKYLKKFPKHEVAINKNFKILREKGSMGVFISKLIPMARTLISIPAGVLKLDFVKYTVSSTLGIFIWNFIFIGAGYVFGEAVFQKLTFL